MSLVYLGFFLHSKKLDATTAELKRTALALEKEKSKTDMLLYQMLPIRVANALRDGQKVTAGKCNSFNYNAYSCLLLICHEHS